MKKVPVFIKISHLYEDIMDICMEKEVDGLTLVQFKCGYKR